MEKNFYLNIGKASEITDKKERRLYRFLEIFPGFLSWLTLFLVILFSWLFPFWIAIFIIAFDIYWLFKTIFLSLHMHSAFNKMKVNLKRNWIKELDKIVVGSEVLAEVKWQDIYHLVILPMYKEPLEVVRSSFLSLTKINYPLNKLIVVLAIEERGGEAASNIAREMEREFGNKFFKFLVTKHPANIAGEIAGKGSNDSWAIKEVKNKIIDGLQTPYERIIVSCFDVDTVVLPDFFGCLTYNYLSSQKPLRSSFQPLPLFINNIWQASAFARIFAFSTTFWQMIQQSRPECLITFSSQSIGFKPLAEIGFWQTNVVSEDSRIFWQCLLNFDGDWRTIPLFFPVYMDANVADTFWQTIKNQYKQIQRWAYGVENNAYFLYGFLKNKKISKNKKWYLGFTMIEGAHSLTTNALIIFLLGWLPTVIGRGGFSETLLSYNLPYLTRLIMTLAMVGLVFTATIATNLLPPRPPYYGRFKYVWMILQWLLFPINMIIFSSIPSLDAQTRLAFGKYLGFWNTPKVRK
ncbi:MAG: glycosyltransferase family 2 protein [Candidatus Azambacteria bacterium]|nr:glycosyltransferase family 2 protein [Candidatus Azambacteria bacterium]